MTSFYGSWNLDFYGQTILNQAVPTQPVIGLSSNYTRWLILTQTFILSKLEFDSTTHVDKRTTFWSWTFDMKIPKNVGNGEKNFNYPKLDIFEFIFLINLMLFGSQRRLELCIEVGVLLNRSWSFVDFSCWNGKSKGHFPDDMVGRIEFWLSSS